MIKNGQISSKGREKEKVESNRDAMKLQPDVNVYSLPAGRVGLRDEDVKEG